MEPNQPADTPSLTTVSTVELADLAGYPPSFLERCRGDLAAVAGLKPTVTVLTGRPGRPQQHYRLDDVAESALRLTEDLSDAECRLRLAFVLLHRQGSAARKLRNGARLRATSDGEAELLCCTPLTRSDFIHLEVGDH